MNKMTEYSEQDWLDLKARRADQLQKLVQEHHECIGFADELIRIAEQGDESELVAGVTKVELYNRMELEEHLQHEEQTILGPLVNEYPEHRPLCVRIGQEHGTLRLLVEQMSMANTRQDLAAFGQLLKSHTMLEEEELFPLIEKVFTPEQMDLVTGFMPFKLGKKLTSFPRQRSEPAADSDQKWLEVVKQHFDQQRPNTASIVLFPGYRPELCAQMAEHLGLAFYDFQKQAMEPLGLEAESINFFELNNALREQAAASGGIVSHNVEALLSIKPELERRSWLRSFIDTDWPNPVVLPITVFQGDVPEDHPQVCDIELLRIR